jgi:hypothetical protein
MRLEEVCRDYISLIKEVIEHKEYNGGGQLANGKAERS